MGWELSGTRHFKDAAASEAEKFRRHIGGHKWLNVAICCDHGAPTSSACQRQSTRGDKANLGKILVLVHDFAARVSAFIFCESVSPKLRRHFHKRGSFKVTLP
jgi:hypothetical protein